MKESRRIPGVILIAAGTILIAAPLTYLAFARWSVGQVDSYGYALPANERASWFALTPVARRSTMSTPPFSASTRIAGTTPPESSEAVATPPPQTGPLTDPPGLEVVELFPAQFINPKYWGAPLWAGSDAFGGPALPDGFERVISPGQGMPPGTSRPATRIVIPAIDVDVVVRDLDPVRRGDALAYEPVDKFVGRIPGTANPGEAGIGWYFGHLESPGLGEGNVFHRFPDISRLIQQDPVDVYLHTESAVFIYRVVETAIVRAEDLSVFDSRESRIALVASFPRRVYTHRLIVFAELYARRALAEG